MFIAFEDGRGVKSLQNGEEDVDSTAADGGNHT